MRGRRKRRRTRIIRLSCYTAAVVFLISATALDSLTWIPFVVCCLSISWLGLVAMANDRRKDEKKSETKIL